MPDRVCSTCCGPIPSARPRSVYCSDPCRYKRRDILQALPCSYCGEPTGWTSSARKVATHPQCKPWVHGTRRAYRAVGCRCVECREWNRVYNKAFRERRRSEGRPLPRPEHAGGWISVERRRSLYERDDWMCQLCLSPVDREADPQSDWYPSLDHIVPRSKGGGDENDNLRTAHRWCNCIRGAEDYHSELLTA